MNQQRFQQFRERYESELAGREAHLRPLMEQARHSGVMLLYAAKDRTHNHAVVLREYLKTFHESMH